MTKEQELGLLQEIRHPFYGIWFAIPLHTNRLRIPESELLDSRLGQFPDGRYFQVTAERVSEAVELEPQEIRDHCPPRLFSLIWRDIGSLDKRKLPVFLSHYLHNVSTHYQNQVRFSLKVLDDIFVSSRVGSDINEVPLLKPAFAFPVEWIHMGSQRRFGELIFPNHPSILASLQYKVDVFDEALG